MTYAGGAFASPSEVSPILGFSPESGVPMAFEAILDEVDQIPNVSTRLEGLAEQHAPITEALMTIAVSVRNTATILAVLVATKFPKPI